MRYRAHMARPYARVATLFTDDPIEGWYIVRGIKVPYLPDVPPERSPIALHEDWTYQIRFENGEWTLYQRNGA